MLETFPNCRGARFSKKRTTALLSLALLSGPAILPVLAAQPPASVAKASGKKAPDSKADNAKPEKTAYDFSFPGQDGKDLPLSTYKGKYLLIVNLGRKSTYNDQLPALIKLNDTYKEKGLAVVGIPSNDFGSAEPGTPAEVLKAYTDAHVNFPVTAPAKVSGDDALPLFNFLTKGKNAPPGGGVHWNYTKFIVDKKGSVIARLDPDVTPDSPEMLATIDQILDGTYKPKKAGGKPDAKPAGSDDEDDDN